VKTAIRMLTVLGSLLLAVPLAGGVGATASRHEALPCAVGEEGCAPAEVRSKERLSSPQHPCSWVETCQLPCSGEGGECCRAEWDCPPDTRLPRC
jgi:hypothetical protein